METTNLSSNLIFHNYENKSELLSKRNPNMANIRGVEIILTRISILPKYDISVGRHGQDRGGARKGHAV